MHRRRAFTLIELLVVVVIISLLTLVAVSSYLVAQRNSRDNARKATVASIATALENFYLQNSRYPGVVDPSTGTSYGGQSIQSRLSGTGGNEPFCIVDDTYYFHPQGLCSQANRNLILPTETNQALIRHGRTAYRPEPTWIPELGSFLNVSAYERRYVDSSGGTSAAAQFIASGSDPRAGQPIVADSNGNLSNVNRTMSYRRFNRLSGQGYAVYAVLENARTPTDAIFTITK
jgi:prepilin-type N-terminal cleavage/methylation domain-containing protein